MRFVTHSFVGAIVLLIAACGGRAADPAGDATRSNSNDDAQGSDDAESDDAADEASGDDDADGTDTSADDAEADDAEADDAEADDAEADDAEADDGETSGETDTSADPSTTSTPPSKPPSGSGTSSPPIAVPPSMGPIAPPIAPAPGGEAPPPEGCGEPTITTGTGYCQHSVSCSNDYFYSNCSDQGNGTWGCSCSSAYTYGNYQLTGVTEATACGPVLELCQGGAAAQPEFGELTCDAPVASAPKDATYCEISQACSQTAELTDTITAVANNPRYASCYDSGTGTLSCSCSSNTASQQYELTSTPLDTACQTVLDICGSDTPPEFPEEATCTQSSRTEGTNQCSVEMQCRRSASAGDNVEVVLNEYQYASCAATPAGAWSCNCSTAERYLSFELAAEDVQADQCVGALGLCTTESPIEPSGEITCENTYQTANGDYCNAQSTCTQNATVDGVTVGLYGNLYASCSSDGAGGWTCSCSSDTESQPLTVEGNDSWEACTAAAASCPDLVSVTIGTGTTGGGVVIGRPIPLSQPANAR